MDGYATISGNLVSNAKTHFYLKGPGNIIGDTLQTENQQIGIDLLDAEPNPTMSD